MRNIHEVKEKMGGIYRDFVSKKEGATDLELNSKPADGAIEYIIAKRANERHNKSVLCCFFGLNARFLFLNSNR